MRLLGASQMALMQLVSVVRDIQINEDSESSLDLQKKYEEILRELETCGVDMEILRIVFEKDTNKRKNLEVLRNFCDNLIVKE